MKNKVLIYTTTMALISFGLLVSESSQAAIFNVEGQLTGDSRDGNPTGLVVDVDIAVNGDLASWVIDINSSLHPNIKMDEFYFNLANVGIGDLADSNYNLSGWDLVSPASVVGGGTFTPNFIFEQQDQVPNPSNNPTNSVNLTFDLTLNRDWTLNDFLLAAVSSSSDTDLGSGQMGVHLQSLDVDDQTCSQGGCSDSGFALGNYDPTIDPDPVPEPTSIILMGAGLLGFFGASRKKVKSA